MSDSANVALSKAIRDALNEDAADYDDVNFQATRKTIPFANDEDLKDLKVVVFDGPKAEERQGRKGTPFLKTYKPTVAVLKKLTTDEGDGQEMAQSDGLQRLVEQIEDWLRDRDLAGLSFVGYDEEQDRDPYNIELLKAQGAFAVAITLEYQG